MPDRPYLFYELTNSLCATCYRKVEAKVVIQDERVYLHKWCPQHKLQKVLISTDAEYYKLSRQTLKPGQMPLKFNTPIKYGCLQVVNQAGKAAMATMSMISMIWASLIRRVTYKPNGETRLL